MPALQSAEAKSFDRPDETRPFDKGRLELVTVGGATMGRAVFQPGWKWSECVKPISKTESCLAAHLGYVVSGRLTTVMDDGTRIDLGPGDACSLPSGHDAWVEGNEPVVMIDFTGYAEYAKPT